MKSFYLFLTYLTLTIYTICAFGQSKTFSKEQMCGDIDVLFSTIEKVHPNMYSVYPKQELTKDVEKIKSDLKTEGDVFYFYKQITPLVAKLGDGHTSVSFPFDYLKTDTAVLLFPFAVKITYPDSAVIVINDYTPDRNAIPKGAQITSINNRSANDIVSEMMNYQSGEKDFFKMEVLKSYFTPLIYTLYGDAIFDIEYMFEQNKYSIQVKGISYTERYRPQQQTVSEPEKYYTFSVLPDKNIGIIKFRYFIGDNKTFAQFLDSTFRVMQKEKIENLIIDIRENGGGSTMFGDFLFQYISPSPFQQFGKVIVKYSKIQKQVNRYIFGLKFPNGTTHTFKNKLIKLRKNELRYKGNIFLLTSHYTFSAGASFSWAFKYFKMGTVIGEETGGLAVTFGDVITQKLPCTEIVYRISYKKFYQYGATDKDTHGTLPDYDVKAENAMDFAIDLIMNKTVRP